MLRKRFVMLKAKEPSTTQLFPDSTNDSIPVTLVTASFDQWSTFCVVADSSHLIKLRKRVRSSSIRSRQNGTSIKSGCLQIGCKRLLKTMAFILKSSYYC